MTAPEIPPPSGFPVEVLLSITEWVRQDDLPAGTDDRLAVLLRRRAPAAVLRPLATIPRERLLEA